MHDAVFAGARLFDGERFHDRHALVLEAGRVRAIVPEAEVADAGGLIRLSGGVLAPGFIDVQVNGGGGRMLNDEPTAETMSVMAAAHRRFGTTGLLPTLITDTPAVTQAAIEATAEACRADPAILGLHLEGPHLAPVRRGAHLAELMRPLGEDDLETLCAAAEALPVLHITLAAEQAAPSQVARLVEAGATVSLGHTDCTSAEAQALFDAGARGVTHLFNAMSGLSHRAPGMVGAALDAGPVWCGIIADGHHVDPLALRVALRAKRAPGRLFFVTDAMALTGSDLDRFKINGREVRREPGTLCGRLVLDDGTLAGSDLDMASAVRFGTTHLELALEEALKMASAYPALYLGLEAERGFLRPGARGDIVHLDEALNVRQVWSAPLS